MYLKKNIHDAISQTVGGWQGIGDIATTFGYKDGMNCDTLVVIQGLQFYFKELGTCFSVIYLNF